MPTGEHRSDDDRNRVRTKPEVRHGVNLARVHLVRAWLAGDRRAGERHRSETLRVNARVLAAYWNEKREFKGFWLRHRQRDRAWRLTLEWFDAPEYPAFKSRPQDIAVPHPQFRVSGK